MIWSKTTEALKWNDQTIQLHLWIFTDLLFILNKYIDFILLFILIDFVFLGGCNMTYP